MGTHIHSQRIIQECVCVDVHAAVWVKHLYKKGGCSGHNEQSMSVFRAADEKLRTIGMIISGNTLKIQMCLFTYTYKI